ncbi:MAG: 1-deoxy-D-xylulose-5-phosphate reductoisomerase, partial [Eubacteriales bacterium]|nr:1-deoxy-D-xylulose-5-phosphate reductoisomerase [Eubacteriales bacterium]
MVSKLSILGSTGSIGTQTLDVARKLNLKVSALSAHSNIELLEEQIREFKPSVAVVFDETKAQELKLNIKDT